MTDGSVSQEPGSGPGGRAPADRSGPGRRRARGGGRRRWLAAGGVAALATVLGLSLALRSGAAPACAAPPVGLAGAGPVAAGRLPLAAPPTGSTVHKGKATFYDSKGAGGNCSYPSAPANRLYVALGPGEYSAGAACGGYLDVTGPRGTVRVLIMDQCPECAPGHVDLSREAFARIADPVQGIVGVSYRAAVDPPLSGPLTFRIKEGASQYWFAALVAEHGNPLRTVEVRQGSGAWRTAARQDYNYWLIDSGAGPGPYAVRVTDVYGHRVTATGITMSPGRVQRSTVTMYGGSAPAARTAPSGEPPSPSPRVTPSRTTSASPSAVATTTPSAPPDVAAAPVPATSTQPLAGRPVDCASRG
ncbi:expansin EXLX1 family cellulose-binding protein [Micromonospora sp. WMMD987]|uniref:expansin EXLX1 family cellulose-binding protein n=1 Tax=Micromonospora TaxID=1873 RepID=UPI00249A754D|nr:expansin EXLX1 family cellulose-binding protein [Micromonospora sp. WMMD987]WFE96629.1 expansin EXLX1 family cellulose-binding protein [Micromonospora sp. WMMD987]